MSPPPGQVPDLVARAAAGDREVIVELLAIASACGAWWRCASIRGCGVSQELR